MEPDIEAKETFFRMNSLNEHRDRVERNTIVKKKTYSYSDYKGKELVGLGGTGADRTAKLEKDLKGLGTEFLAAQSVEVIKEEELKPENDEERQRLREKLKKNEYITSAKVELASEVVKKGQ